MSLGSAAIVTVTGGECEEQKRTKRRSSSRPAGFDSTRAGSTSRLQLSRWECAEYTGEPYELGETRTESPGAVHRDLISTTSLIGPSSPSLKRCESNEYYTTLRLVRYNQRLIQQFLPRDFFDCLLSIRIRERCTRTHHQYHNEQV
jgi:hypothetical protein